MLAERIKGGEIERRSKSCPDHRRKRSAPKLFQRVRTPDDSLEGSYERYRPGLLNSGF